MSELALKSPFMIEHSGENPWLRGNADDQRRAGGTNEWPQVSQLSVHL